MQQTVPGQETLPGAVRRPGRTVRLGRATAPAFVAVTESTGAKRLVSGAVRYLNVLQGLGGGSGWNVTGETRAMTTPLRGLRAPVVVDGGANWGDWSRAVHATLGDEEARFFLVEPQSACQDSIRRLPIKHATVIQAALGAEPGEGLLSAREAGFPAASLYERRDGLFGDMSAHREPVRVTTLDDIVAEHRIDRIDLLKLDLEGGELAALRGAASCLERGVVRNLAFEFGEPNLYSRVFFRDFWDLLDPLGFAMARVLPGGRLRPVDAYSVELEHFRGVSNYLATLPG
jgi:FkbM family methyltransferase